MASGRRAPLLVRGVPRLAAGACFGAVALVAGVLRGLLVGAGAFLGVLVFVALPVAATGFFRVGLAWGLAGVGRAIFLAGAGFLIEAPGALTLLTAAFFFFGTAAFFCAGRVVFLAGAGFFAADGEGLVGIAGFFFFDAGLVVFPIGAGFFFTATLEALAATEGFFFLGGALGVAIFFRPGGGAFLAGVGFFAAVLAATGAFFFTVVFAAAFFVVPLGTEGPREGDFFTEDGFTEDGLRADTVRPARTRLLGEWDLALEPRLLAALGIQTPHA